MPTDHPQESPMPARPARERLLVLLKTRGPQTAAALGAALDITGEAARQQLVKLAAEGFVEPTSEPRGVGRPAQLWNLTEKGNAYFPDAHAALTVQLLGAIRSELGDKALDRLIRARAAESLASYKAALQGAADLGERVRRLAEARTREGYMAECQPAQDGYLLIENHCPICAAATACQGFCRAEQDVFQQALGKGVSVERTEHIVEGARRCAYRVALKCVPEARAAKRKEPLRKRGQTP
jgi:predicted ArsR family transcriptional regulator